MCLQVLPKESKVVSVKPHGTSDWASTARVETEMGDGSQKTYFLKILRGPNGGERVLGEYMSMTEIYKTFPSIAPQPRGYGKCKDEDVHFFLCDYLFIKNVLPDPVRLGKKLAELHRRSESPTGKFGFHCTTFDGKLPLTTAWDSNWTSFFTKLMRGVYELDVEVNGFWQELDDAMKEMLDKLIPRLLDPLTAEGRTIKPCLIHGDLWESNIGTEEQTGEIYIFDACAYYAHHEKELGIWRCKHHDMKEAQYREKYFENFKPSEPKEEFDDRNRLYSVETLLINSAHFPGSVARSLALNELNWLINKYRQEM
ncbi:Fructosamine/Ketosamine-3-kinase [Parachaetomium inaequale]|uniref:protein-ribulosamine 3-kinase n=1 Tax=Parachaetomium inaequale TaxID=2588326 RepID=A0AAN6SQD3_9PEZI|nr:Fructosamine/Ketosamine-3-kinase [Parachaetomium inaequale]